MNVTQVVGKGENTGKKSLELTDLPAEVLFRIQRRISLADLGRWDTTCSRLSHVSNKHGFQPIFKRFVEGSSGGEKIRERGLKFIEQKDVVGLKRLVAKGDLVLETTEAKAAFHRKVADLFKEKLCDLYQKKGNFPFSEIVELLKLAREVLVKASYLHLKQYVCLSLELKGKQASNDLTKQQEETLKDLSKFITEIPEEDINVKQVKEISKGLLGNWPNRSANRFYHELRYQLGIFFVSTKLGVNEGLTLIFRTLTTPGLEETRRGCLETLFNEIRNEKEKANDAWHYLTLLPSIRGLESNGLLWKQVYVFCFEILKSKGETQENKRRAVTVLGLVMKKRSLMNIPLKDIYWLKEEIFHELKHANSPGSRDYLTALGGVIGRLKGLHIDKQLLACFINLKAALHNQVKVQKNKLIIREAANIAGIILNHRECPSRLRDACIDYLTKDLQDPEETHAALKQFLNEAQRVSKVLWLLSACKRIVTEKGPLLRYGENTVKRFNKLGEDSFWRYIDMYTVTYRHDRPYAVRIALELWQWDNRRKLARK